MGSCARAIVNKRFTLFLPPTNDLFKGSKNTLKLPPTKPQANHIGEILSQNTVHYYSLRAISTIAHGCTYSSKKQKKHPVWSAPAWVFFHSALVTVSSDLEFVVKKLKNNLNAYFCHQSTNRGAVPPYFGLAPTER